jgi:glycosyltransferase involved in cell wall biosynthesis
MDLPEISIVIRTYNEARFLPDLLEAINRQRLHSSLDYQTPEAFERAA